MNKHSDEHEPFSEMTWLVENEKTFSKKLLLILGGITSFGGIFPTFYQNLKDFNSIKSIKDPFELFVALYFLLPSLVFLVWIFFSRRVSFHGKLGEEVSSGHWTTRINRLFFWAILINLFISFIFVRFEFFREQRYFILIPFLIELLILTGIVCRFWYTFAHKTKNWREYYSFYAILLAYTVLVVALFTFACKHLQFKTCEPLAYEKILDTYRLKSNIESLEKNTQNVTERFYLKSKINLDNYNHIKEKYFRDANNEGTRDFDGMINSLKEKNKCLNIRPYIDFFNALIIQNHAIVSGSLQLDTNYYVAQLDLDEQIKPCYDDKRFFRPSRIIKNYYAPQLKNSALPKINTLPYVEVIMVFMDTMLNNDDQILASKNTSEYSLLPIWFSEDLDQIKDTALLRKINQVRKKYAAAITCSSFSAMVVKEKGIRDSILNTLPFKEIFRYTQKLRTAESKELTMRIKDYQHELHAKKEQLSKWESRLKGLGKKNFGEEYLAASLNFQNSQLLYEWMQDFLAYAQRKTQSEIRKTNEEVNWIWLNTQKMGLIVFSVFLLILLLYYLCLYRLRVLFEEESKKQSNDDKGLLPAPGTEAYEKMMNDWKGKNSKLNYYTFPVTTFLAIIFALILPLLSEIKPGDINMTKPGWMLNIPNWNLTSIVVDNTNIHPLKDKTPEPTGIISSSSPGSQTVSCCCDLKKLDALEADLKQIKNCIQCK